MAPGVNFTKSCQCEIYRKFWRHNASFGCDVITYNFTLATVVKSTSSDSHVNFGFNSSI